MNLKTTIINLKKIHHAYSLSILNLLISPFIIYNYIIVKFDFDLLKIADIFTINTISYSIFTIISGFLFDKFGSKIILSIERLAIILSLLCLMFAFKNPIFLIPFMIFDSMQNAFSVGKREALIYQQVVEKIDSSGLVFAKFLSILYLATDILRFINPIVSSIILGFGENTTLTIIYIYTILQILGFFIISTLPNQKRSQKKISNLLKSTIIAVNNKNTRSSIIMFAIFTSLMYSYKEIFTISLRISENQLSYAMPVFASIYHLFISIGCLVAVLFPVKFLQKYKLSIIYQLPISCMIVLLILSCVQNEYLLIYSFCGIATTFCIFEVILDNQIDKNLNQDSMGSVNSILWFLSSLMGSLFSIFITIASRFITHSFLLLSIPFFAYICIMVFAYKKDEKNKFA